MTATLAPSLFGKMFNAVEEFAIVFDQPHPSEPTFPSAELKTHRRNMLAEEVGEYFTAEQENDLVEVADALGDIIYITLGTAIAYGLMLPGGRDYLAWDLIGSSRLSGPQMIRDHAQKAMVDAWFKYIQAEEDGSDLQWIGSTIQNVFNVCLEIAYVYSIPMEKIFDEVHSTNMAKLQNGVVVRHPETGKVLKPEGWQPPNLRKILIEAGAVL